MKRMSAILLASLLCSVGSTTYATEIISTEEILQSNIILVTDDLEDTSSLLSQAVLKDVKAVNDNDENLIIKTCQTPPDFNPNSLIELDFEKNGYQYKQSYLLLVSENTESQTKLASQTVTVAHEQKDGAVARLTPLVDYDVENFKGQLTLDINSIYTEVAEKNSYTYPITDTREYTGMERNDTYGIAKTITKNGASLSLVDVDWTHMGEGSYKATAYYSGSAIGVNVSGYRSTATYIGEVTKEQTDSVTYAVIYEGDKITLPAPSYLPFVIGAILLIAAIIGSIALFQNRKNARIYTIIDGQYKVVHKIKIYYIDPIIDLTAPSLGAAFREYIVVIDRFAAKRLNNQFIRVICADGTVKEHRMISNGYGCKLNLGGQPKTEGNETI